MLLQSSKYCIKHTWALYVQHPSRIHLTPSMILINFSSIKIILTAQVTGCETCKTKESDENQTSWGRPSKQQLLAITPGEPLGTLGPCAVWKQLFKGKCVQQSCMVKIQGGLDTVPVGACGVLVCGYLRLGDGIRSPLFSCFCFLQALFLHNF